MTETTTVDEATLTERVVLAGVAGLATDGETPAHTGEVGAVCRDALAAVGGGVVDGTLTEAAVSRALNRLDAGGLVDGTRDETSAAGKGRPRFELATDPQALLDALGDDEAVSPVVAHVSVAESETTG